MPIDYNKYPKNWKTEIRPRILKRAENKCEFCGVENYSFVFSSKINNKTYWSKDKLSDTSKKVKVILTIAHLDHDSRNENIQDDRLKALCQLCHLNYDRK